MSSQERVILPRREPRHGATGAAPAQTKWESRSLGWGREHYGRNEVVPLKRGNKGGNVKAYFLLQNSSIVLGLIYYTKMCNANLCNGFPLSSRSSLQLLSSHMYCPRFINLS